jgi:hypothetical protein
VPIAPAARRIAALKGRVLLALVEAERVAALSLYDERVVANPFAGTHDAVALLRLRAAHLLGERPRRQWRAIPRLHTAVRW